MALPRKNFAAAWRKPRLVGKLSPILDYQLPDVFGNFDRAPIGGESLIRGADKTGKSKRNQATCQFSAQIRFEGSAAMVQEISEDLLLLLSQQGNMATKPLAISSFAPEGSDASIWIAGR